MIFIKDMKTKEISNFIMVFVGSYKYLKETKSISKNSYLKKEASFDGSVLYFSPKYGFINGWKYENGKIVSKISPTVIDSTSQISEKRTKGYVEDCYYDYICIDYETCWETGYDDPEFGFVSYGENCDYSSDCYSVDYCTSYYEPDDDDYNDWDYDGDSYTSPEPGNADSEITKLLDKFTAYYQKMEGNYRTLTQAEKDFITKNPSIAVSFLRNAETARDQCAAYYPNLANVDTMRDAFRHAYWSALDAYDWGRPYAEAYGTAHEAFDCTTQTDKGTCAQQAMDLYNNNIGYIIGQQVRDEGGTRTDILERIKDLADRGALQTLR